MTLQRLKISVIAAALAGAVVPLSASLVERWYATGLYPQLQRVLTPLSNLFPFALFDVMTLAAIALVLVVLVRAIRRARRERRWSPIPGALLTLGAAAAAVYLAFLLSWGLNYRRIPMSRRLVLEQGELRPGAAVSLGLRAADRLNALYETAHGGSAERPWLDGSLREAFSRVQGFLSDARPAVPGRLKPTIFGPCFRWASVDGMVNPFALEVLANPDLLSIERPFVAAHEWAHLAGYADESEASFVGWLTCVHAGPAAEYSGWLYLYGQLNAELDPPDRERLGAALGPGPHQDLDAVIDRVRRGQWLPLRKASWRVYDRYLRANRVTAGIRSYDLVVMLILRARFEEGWKPVRRAPRKAPSPAL
jgi:hypothetical protein